jgi:hypothetical protein
MATLSRPVRAHHFLKVAFPGQVKKKGYLTLPWFNVESQPFQLYLGLLMNQTFIYKKIGEVKSRRLAIMHGNVASTWFCD